MRAYEFITEQDLKWDFKPGWEVQTPGGQGVVQNVEGQTAYVELYDHLGVHPYEFRELLVIDTHGIKEAMTPRERLRRAGIKTFEPVSDELRKRIEDTKKKSAQLAKKRDTEVDEQSPSANAYALIGSGRGGSTKKPGVDSPEHKKVRTPGTTYSKTRRKYNAGAKPGAVDGFVG